MGPVGPARLRGRGGGGAAARAGVAQDQERRGLAGRCPARRVVGRVVVAMRNLPSIAGRIAERDGTRQQAVVNRKRARRAEHTGGAGLELDRHDRGAPVRRAADECGRRAFDLERVDARPRQRNRAHRAVRIEPAQPPSVARAPGADDASARVEPERGRSELPQRLPELEPGPMHATKLPVPPAVEIPPSLRIGDAPERPVRRPGGLERGAARAAGDSGRRAGCSLPVELGEPQRRRIPGHVRLVPGEPGKVPSVGAGGRCGVEVTAGREHPRGAVVDRYRHEIVDGRGIAPMRLAHRKQAPPPRVEGQIPEPGRALGGEGGRRGGARPGMHPTVRVAREPQPVPGYGVRAASVLVHAGAHVERRGNEVLEPSRSVGSNEHVAPAFPGTPLEPTDATRLQADRREPDRFGNDGLGGDRGRPRSEG